MNILQNKKLRTKIKLASELARKEIKLDVSNIVTVLTSLATGFSGIFTTIVNSVISVFWNTGESTPTILGVLGLIGLILTLLRFGISFIRGFFTRSR